MVICNFTGCNKRATYGLIQGSPLNCNQHKSINMIDVIKKKCLHQCCYISSSFGLIGGKVTYCAQHKTEEMIDLRNKKCLYENCNKIPSFGIDKKTHCAEHKTKEMINLVSKLCLHENCDSSASFGIKKVTHCSEHKTNEMTNLKHKKCLHEGCNIIATFGILNTQAIYCLEHKTDEMTNVQSKKCLHENCILRPCFGLTKGNPIYCFQHKDEKMYDVINKLCKNCNLFRVGNTNYLCSYCNPDKQENTKRKEIIIKEFLEQNNLQFIHNKQIQNECCLKYRPDFLFDCKTYFVILEVDEDAHSGYAQECEIIRMNNISSGLGLPTLFIRYNPDKVGIKQKEKHKTLLKILQDNLSLEYLVDPSPIYLFY